MKKKKKPTDDECDARLQATVDALAADGADLFDIVTSFIGVATNLALRDEAYKYANLARLEDLFTLGANCTRLEIERITPPKKPRKKKNT